MDIGTRILHLREVHELTQYQLGQRSGLRDYAISRIESGREPKARELVALARAFGMSLDELVNGDEQRAAPLPDDASPDEAAELNDRRRGERRRAPGSSSQGRRGGPDR